MFRKVYRPEAVSSVFNNDIEKLLSHVLSPEMTSLSPELASLSPELTSLCPEIASLIQVVASQQSGDNLLAGMLSPGSGRLTPGSKLSLG